MRYLQPGEIVLRGDAAPTSGFRIVERLHPLDQADHVDPRSAVYRARDEAGDLGEVVLKFPNWEPSEEEAHVERLRATARRLTRLAHPNVARIHDVCFDRDDRLFFVLEYVDGSPLRNDAAFGDMTVADFVPLASQLAEALAGAHRQGLLWCDVKPGNALVVRDSSGRKLLKLIDPGEVRAIDRPSDLTGSTPENVAPERRGIGPSSLNGSGIGRSGGERAPASRRTEVYELGLVFYEMLTGKRGDEAGAALRDGLERPDLPEEIRSLIRTMLERDPRRRCPSMAEVVRRLGALEAAAGDRTVTLDVAQLTETIRLDDTLGAQAVRALVFGDYDRLIFLHYTSLVLEVVALDADEIAVPRATSYTLDLRNGYLTREGESRPLRALFDQIDWGRVSPLGPREGDADRPSTYLDARSPIGKALLLGMDQLYEDHSLRGREGVVFVLLDQAGDSDEERAILESLGGVLQEVYYPPLRHDQPRQPRGAGRTRLADAVDELLRTAPLRYPYVLGTATWTGSEYAISSREVFGLNRRSSGTRRHPAMPPRQVVTLRSPSSADQHVLLALFARVDERPLAEQPLVQASWAYLRAGETCSLGLTLERAGRVQLSCVDAEESFLVSLPTRADDWEGDPPASDWLRVPENRAEAERHVRDQIARVDPIEDDWQRSRPRPVQICLILDSIGDSAAIDERRQVAVELLQGLERLPERARFRIALVAYGDHRHVERVAYDEPDVYLDHDFGTIDQAIAKLGELRPLEGQDFEGCFEDALQRASSFGWRREARALVAIVNRPPHPAEVEYRRDEGGRAVVYDQIACPGRVDWEAELEALDGAGIGELFSFVLCCPQHWKLLRWAWLDPRNAETARLVFEPDQAVEKDPPPHAVAYRQAFLEGLARTHSIELQPDSTGRLSLPADFVKMVGRTVAAPPLPTLADT